MAGTLNKVLLLGSVGKDPDTRNVGTTKVASFSIATNETYKDKEGKKVENTDWHDIELWGALAEITEKYVKKGDKVLVEGKMKTHKWTDKDGNNRYKVFVKGEAMTMVGSAKREGQAERPQTFVAQDVAAQEGDDGLPF